MSIKIYPYNMNSESAGLLADALRTRLIINEQNRSSYTPRMDDMIINWGSTNCWIDPNSVGLFLNKPDKVHNVSNKLLFFQNYNTLFSHPVWTTSPAEVLLWLQRGHVVFARTTLAGTGGEGIIQLEYNNYRDLASIPAAPLYTRYIPKAAEYRVHMIDENIVDIQQKVRREGVQGDFRVRSHDNGFVFARTVNNIPVVQSVPDVVRRQARLALVVSELDFAGADVIYNRAQNKAYVLELNSAPGIEGSTVDVYSNVFNEMYGDGI